MSVCAGTLNTDIMKDNIFRIFKQTDIFVVTTCRDSNMIQDIPCYNAHLDHLSGPSHGLQPACRHANHSIINTHFSRRPQSLFLLVPVPLPINSSHQCPLFSPSFFVTKIDKSKEGIARCISADFEARYTICYPFKYLDIYFSLIA